MNTNAETRHGFIAGFMLRFVFIYTVLYTLVWPLITASIPLLHSPALSLRLRAFWTRVAASAASTVVHADDYDTAFLASDSVLGWALVGGLLIMAVVVAVMWSVLDRRRESDAKLRRRLVFLLRMVLAFVLVDYGAQKIWPLQMPLVRPHELIAPLGSYAPGRLLWVFMGASPGYERFTGCVEMAAGGLLFIPWLARVGALLAAPALTNVFALNVFYDVPVKLGALHLLCMALLLVSSDLRLLANALITGASTSPTSQPFTASTSRARAAAVVQMVLGAAVIGNALWFYHSLFPRFNVVNTEAVPFYGVWEVEEFSVDGVSHPPLSTDEVRWLRVIFDDAYSAFIQRMNGSVIAARMQRDTIHGTLSLKYGDGARHPEIGGLDGPHWVAEFTTHIPSVDTLLMTGKYNDRAAELRLRRSEIRFPLQTHVHQWILRRRPAYY